MMAIMEALSKQQNKDISLIGKFVQVYCDGRHDAAKQNRVALPGTLGLYLLCPDCAAFLEYAVTKRLKCPLESEKPTCKHCQIHCYDQSRRDKVREIMSYAGRKMLIRGRLDYIWHYFF